MIWNKRIFKNLFSLGFIQIFNNLTPIITFPIIIRNIGVEDFGIVSTIFAINMFLGSVVDFGFDFIGVKRLSTTKVNEDWSTILSETISIKLILAIFLFFIYVIITISFFDNSLTYIIGAGIFLVRIISMTWFFQGIEEMKFNTYSNLISNLVFLFMIIILIKEHKTFNLVLISKVISLSIGALISLIFTLRKVKFKLSLKITPSYFRDSFFVFSSILFSSILQNSPVILISRSISYEAAGYYSTIEKIISFGKQILFTLNQAYFPKLSSLYPSNIQEFLKLRRLVFIIATGLAISFIIIIMISKSYILQFLFSGNKGDITNGNLMIMMLGLIITYSIINHTGLNGLLIIGEGRKMAISQAIPILLVFLIVLIYPRLINSLFKIILCLYFIDIIIIIIRITIWKKNKLKIN